MLQATELIVYAKIAGTLEHRWLALLVQSGTEPRCQRYLLKHKLKAYWPHYHGMVPRNGKKWMMGRRSVIPGYLFVPVPDDQWHRLNWRLIRNYCAYLRGFLRDADGGYIYLPVQSIERIRDIELALRSSPVAAKEGIPFKKGQRVLIKQLEIEGIIVRIDGKRQIAVETTMFGQTVLCNLAASAIDAV